MESAFQEALNLLIRWIHVLAAIMWIGDSFLFMWLDSHLETPSKKREGDVVGELWMTHSGGFYEVIKRRYLAKDEMPPNLYWFKWESYTTWITGFLLLFVVYYLNGASYLVDATVSDLATAEGILLSLGLLAGGFIVYDALWSSPLGKRPWILAPLCFFALIAIAAWLTTLYSGRAAYLQIGAMMGTIMTANVFFRIIPAQKNMLAAAREGREVDTTLGLRAKMRSRHNHYMTLPVLFAMLSNHFPSTFGASTPWLVLALVFLFGAGLKYIMNYRGKAGPHVWLGTIGALVAVLFMTTGPTLSAHGDDSDLAATEASWPEVNRIVQARCASCHATVPSNTQFKTPPAGIALEAPEQIVQLAPRILQRVYVDETMPLGNLTKMTDEERAKVAAWITQGAQVKEAPRWDGEVPEELLVEARELYRVRCVTCHGDDGRGDGVLAKAMLPSPTDLHDRSWHAQVSDDEIAKVILEGGPALDKSGTMPPNIDLEERPEIVRALVRVVRDFEDPAPEAAPGFPNVDPSPRRPLP